MNYLAQIRAFNDLILVYRLFTGQIALWYALMSVNNRCAWKPSFTVANLTLELMTGLTRRSIYNARGKLKELGLITFESNGMQATRYSLLPIFSASQVYSQTASQEGSQFTSQRTSQVTSTLNKQNKYKQNNTNKKNTSYNLEELDEYWNTVPKL